MESEVLPEYTKKLLAKFRTENLPPGSYLGGDTAIALWIGHRQSVDLDWFAPQEFDEKMWQMRWETMLGFLLQGRDWQTLTGQADRVKTALYYYKSPLIDAPGNYEGIKVAGLKGLAAMKLDAVMSLGTRRVLIDLYFLIKQFGANNMFEFYDDKYGHSEDRQIMLRKAIVYFTEADEDEVPKMLLPIKWKEVKEFFLKVFI